MTTYLIYTAVAGAFAIGVGLGVLIMCLIAMGKLGDDPLAEIEIPESPIPRQYQD